MLNVIIWFCLFVHGCSKPIPDGNDEILYNNNAGIRNFECNDCSNKEVELPMNNINDNTGSNEHETHMASSNKIEVEDNYHIPNMKRGTIPPDKSGVLHCKPSDTRSSGKCMPSINIPIESCYPNMHSHDDADCSVRTPTEPIISEGKDSIPSSFITLSNTTSDKAENKTFKSTLDPLCNIDPLQLNTPINSPCIATSNTPASTPYVTAQGNAPYLSPSTNVYTPNLTPYSIPCNTPSNIAYSLPCNTPSYQPAHAITAPSVLPIVVSHPQTHVPLSTTAPTYYIQNPAPCATPISIQSLPNPLPTTQFSAPCTTTLSTPISAPCGLPPVAHYMPPPSNPPCTPHLNTHNFVFNFNNSIPGRKHFANPPDATLVNPSYNNDCEACNIHQGDVQYEPYESEAGNKHYDEDQSNNIPSNMHEDNNLGTHNYEDNKDDDDDENDEKQSSNKCFDTHAINECGDMPDKMLRPYIIGAPGTPGKPNGGSNTKIHDEEDAGENKDSQDTYTKKHYNNEFTDEIGHDTSYSTHKPTIKDTTCDSHDCGEKSNLNDIIDISSSKHNDDDTSCNHVNDEITSSDKHNIGDTSSDFKPSLNDIFDGCCKTHNDECKPYSKTICSQKPGENDADGNGKTPCNEKDICDPKCSNNLLSGTPNEHDILDEERSSRTPCSEDKICNPQCTNKPNVNDILDDENSSNLPCDENAICNPAGSESTPSDATPCTTPYHQHEHNHEHHHDDSSTTYVHEHHHHHHHHHNHDHIHHQCYPSCCCHSNPSANNGENSNNNDECGATRTPDGVLEMNNQTSASNNNNTQTMNGSHSNQNANRSKVIFSSIDQICDFLTNSSNTNKVIADKRTRICCCNRVHANRRNRRNCVRNVVDKFTKEEAKKRHDNDPITNRISCCCGCPRHHHFRPNISHPHSFHNHHHHHHHQNHHRNHHHTYDSH